VFKALQFILDLDLDADKMKYVIHENQTKRPRFTQDDKLLAQIVKDGINNLESKNAHHFRIHTKGLGIFCDKKEGIEQNSLVVEYFGEMYRQWFWFEKQDIIKQG